MTIFEMMQQSLVLTVLGMTIVFAFLWIMVFVITLVGKIINGMGLNKDISKPETIAPVVNKTVSPEITAAITAAITEYRKKEINS